MLPFHRLNHGLFSLPCLHATVMATTRCFSTTYYDSQSGLHVPIHDESMISLYMAWQGMSENFQGLTPKQDSLSALGFDGAIISACSRNTDEMDEQIEAWERLVSISHKLELFWEVTPSERTVVPTKKVPSYLNLMFNFADVSESKEAIKQCIANGIKTSLWLRIDDDSLYNPIQLASQVATLIDSTGGLHILWVSPCDNGESNQGEVVVKLCEELSYLDVSGPTIKSRLAVDLRNSDSESIAEECMSMGVNKFLIEKEQFNGIRDLIEENGKEIRR